uniref:Uncharacterized protein n=1 Tax=Anopheles atroparvus TaxID=41427 RepID=A0A182J9C2_ANOAO
MDHVMVQTGQRGIEERGRSLWRPEVAHSRRTIGHLPPEEHNREMLCMQSTPKVELFSTPWRAFSSDRVSIGGRPLFSARASGIDSSATLNERNAYCSRVDNDTRVADQRPHHAQSVVDGTLRLGRDHLVAAADEHGNGAGVLAVLDHQHLVLGRAKAQLPHESRRTEFIGGQFFEPRHDAPTGGDCNQFDFRSANPANGRELLLQEQMVRLVIETPLADGQSCPGILHLLDHQQELLLLVLPQLAVVVGGRDIELMLRLRLRWLERAGEDGQLDVLEHRRHLRVGHRQHGIDRDLGHLAVALVHNLAAERRHGNADQRFLVVARHRERLGDRIQMLDGALGGQLEPVGNANRMYAPVEQGLSLLEQRSGQNDHPSRAVADFVVLRLAQLNHQLADLVINIHQFQDRCAIVSDRHVTIPADHHLIQSLRSQRRTDN